MTFPVALPILIFMDFFFAGLYLRKVMLKRRRVYEINLVYDLDHVEIVFQKSLIVSLEEVVLEKRYRNEIHSYIPSEV